MQNKSVLPIHNNMQQSWMIDLLWLTGIFLGLFFIALGSRPLFTPDEGRYAEIAREMAQTGDFITPYLNTIKYFEKPALFYWLSAIALKIGGVNIWSLRLVNAILATLCGLLTYAATRTLFNRNTGFLAALILSTSLLFFVMARMITLDLPVTVFMTCALYAFILGMHKLSLAQNGRYFFWLAAASAACAVLTKGLIGIVFPGMIILTWLLLIGQLRILAKIHLLSSLLVFFLIVAPWHILVALKNPGFLYFYFIQQHILRYTTAGIGHTQPSWYFVPIVLLGLMPWGFFLPQTLLFNLSQVFRGRKKYANELFLLLWAFLIFIFFSFSHSKLIPYILPVFPPLAILTAHYLDTRVNQGKTYGIYMGLIALLIASGLFAFYSYRLSQYTDLTNPGAAHFWLVMGSAILVAGALSSCLLAYRQTRVALYCLIVTSGLFFITLMVATPAIQTRSILPLANYLQPILKSTDTVVSYNQYFQDLPFYLQRRVSILNWRNELSYGMKGANVSDFMLNNETFWHKWQSTERVFVILSMEELSEVIKNRPKERIIPLTKTPKYALITNHNLN